MKETGGKRRKRTLQSQRCVALDENVPEIKKILVKESVERQQFSYFTVGF